MKNTIYDLRRARNERLTAYHGCLAPRDCGPGHCSEEELGLARRFVRARVPGTKLRWLVPGRPAAWWCDAPQLEDLLLTSGVMPGAFYWAFLEAGGLMDIMPTDCRGTNCSSQLVGISAEVADYLYGLPLFPNHNGGAP